MLKLKKNPPKLGGHTAFTATPNATFCQNPDCGSKFGLLTHRHHCKMCRGAFCSKCLSSKLAGRICSRCRIPKLLLLEPTAMQNIFKYLTVKEHLKMLLTCRLLQTNLPLVDLEYKDIETWNFANRVQIGKGGCGTVFRVDHPLHGKLAVKIVPKSSVTNMYVWKRVIEEIHIMKLMDHPNVVKTLDSFQTATDVVIVTAYAEGGTLRQGIDYIRKHNLNVERFAAHVCTGICNALTYIWTKHGIAHRDLKMENVVLNKDFSQVIVIDFGLAEFTKPTDQQQSVETYTRRYVPCGTVGYASPENIYAIFTKPSELNATTTTMHKCDMYSMGVMLWNMLTNTKVFTDHNFKRIKAVMDQGTPCEGLAWRGVSAGAKEACGALLSRSTPRRPTSIEFVTIPWVIENAVAFQSDLKNISAAIEETESDWDNMDDGWVFIQYGGFVESSWVLLEEDASTTGGVRDDKTTRSAAEVEASMSKTTGQGKTSPIGKTSPEKKRIPEDLL
eukprot:PhF_6_TR30197/c0_g1_i1/m.44381